MAPVKGGYLNLCLFVSTFTPHRRFYWQQPIALTNYAQMELYDINRVALIISPSETLLKWAISEAPSLAEDIDLDDPSDLSTVYLLPDFDDIEEADDWIEDNYLPILETLLEEWIPEDSWPDRLEFTHLEKYADYSFSNVVIAIRLSKSYESQN